MSNATRFLNGGRGLGVIDPATATAAITTFFSTVSSLFGGDKVPNYPIKLQSTLDSLKASVIEHVGTLPPTSVEDAKIKLQKAIARQAYEDSIGHGWGDGPGWDTLMMLYDEVIAGLRNYIATGGGSVPFGGGSTPTTTTLPGGSLPTTQQPGGFGRFIQDNPLLVAGAAVGIVYFVTRKKRR